MNVLRIAIGNFFAHGNAKRRGSRQYAYAYRSQ
jgi:hypothetical protein